MGSDDASYLILNGSTLINLGGRHSYRTRRSSFEANSARCRPFEILYGQRGGGASMRFQIQTPKGLWIDNFSMMFFTEGKFDNFLMMFLILFFV